MSREALVLLVCCCDFRDRAERLIPSKSLRNAVIWAFPGLLCILRMCAPRRAAAVVRPRGREKSADRRRRILISRLLIIRASVPRRKSPFPAYFKGFPAVSPLIPPYPTFLKYPVSPHIPRTKRQSMLCLPAPKHKSPTACSVNGQAAGDILYGVQKKNAGIRAYSWGPAETRALPCSLPSYFLKFLMKRPARSLAFSSHWEASA